MDMDITVLTAESFSPYYVDIKFYILSIYKFFYSLN